MLVERVEGFASEQEWMRANAEINQFEAQLVAHGIVLVKRKKKPSRRFRGAFAHTPLSAEENIPWKCRRLVIGTGTYGNLPVMDDLKREAARRKIELVILPTAEAIRALRKASEKTNAILHVTC